MNEDATLRRCEHKDFCYDEIVLLSFLQLLLVAAICIAQGCFLFSFSFCGVEREDQIDHLEIIEVFTTAAYCRVQSFSVGVVQTCGDILRAHHLSMSRQRHSQRTFGKVA